MKRNESDFLSSDLLFASRGKTRDGELKAPNADATSEARTNERRHFLK
jgi:hypothetical protein